MAVLDSGANRAEDAEISYILLPTHAQTPYYHIHHQSGPPVVDDEPSLTHHYIPKVTVYMSIHY